MVSIIPAENDEDGYESVEGKEQANPGKSKRWKQPLRHSTSGPLIGGERMERVLLVLWAWCDGQVTYGCSKAMGGVEGMRCPQKIVERLHDVLR